MPTETTTTALDEAATMILGWGDSDVLDTLNMGEGNVLANLFRSLGRTDIADHIVVSVWNGENEWDRDPEPWINAEGERKSDREIRAQNLTDVFRFEPRHGAGYECIKCEAYEGEFVRRDGITKCKACVDEEMRLFIVRSAAKSVA